ncbi:translation initiation factor IF-2-like [Helianthus annuus]|uniref:translation initiation factor IF-2-like n=1 Tax=Helianthus annuus TaxID=4232 RepID=UPI000B8FBB22|nr:translation initiation factor IF-2-like [Helianthus annuus]
MANDIMEDYKVLGRKEQENARLRAEAEALEVTNLKAVNAALVKEKSAAEAVAKEAKEAEAHAAKALEEANADHSRLNKVVEDLKAEVQNRVTIIEEVTARAAEAKARAREAAEARDSLVSSFDQLKADRDWMRDHVIGHIVRTILDAPKNTAAVNKLRERAREAGFKAGFQGVDTEARLAAALEAYNNMSISAINDIDNCLDAEDYVDRLRLLYGDPEEEEE